MLHREHLTYRPISWVFCICYDCKFYFIASNLASNNRRVLVREEGLRCDGCNLKFKHQCAQLLIIIVSMFLPKLIIQLLAKTFSLHYQLFTSKLSGSLNQLVLLVIFALLGMLRLFDCELWSNMLTWIH